MKIMLVLPKFETHILTPPLGLGYLASSLIKAGHEVVLLDCCLKNISSDAFANVLKKENPSLVGINAMTSYYTEAIKYVNQVKKLGIIACLGGPHISALPENSLLESGADFVLLGESDKTLVELVNALENKKSFSKIKGIGFKKNGKIIINTKADLIKDLDGLPFPAWNLMNPGKYPIAPHGAIVKRFPVAPIITTRGCPFNCSFCSSKCIWMQRLRFRNPEKVVDEIEYLQKKYNIKGTFFVSAKFAKKYPNLIKKIESLLNNEI